MPLFTFIQIAASVMTITLAVRLCQTGRFLKLKDILVSILVGIFCFGMVTVSQKLEVLAMLVILPILFWHFKKDGEDTKELFFILPLAFILMMIADSLMGVIVIHLFDLETLSPEILRTDIVLYIFFLSSVLGIVSLLAWATYKVRRLMVKYRHVINNRSFIFSIIVVCVLVFFSFYWWSFTIDTSSGEGYLAVTVAMFMVLISVVIVLMMFVQYKLKDIRLESKKIEMEQLSHYLRELEYLYDDMRKFKHDYVNMLSSMAGLINENDMATLKVFFTNNIAPLGKKFMEDDIKLGKLSFLEQVELKGLISSKCLYAQDLGISVHLDITEPIRIHMEIIDLCRIVGIWLDNAIEAALTSSTPKLKVGIIKKGTVVYLVIANTVKEMPALFKLREAGFSTKGKGRGIGLANVQKILNNYAYITNDMIFEADEFRQVLEVYEE